MGPKSKAKEAWLEITEHWSSRDALVTQKKIGTHDEERVKAKKKELKEKKYKLAKV